MNWENEFDRIEKRKDFKFEYFKLSVIEIILNYMKEKGVNQTQLAKTLDISNVAVTKLLSGRENFSLKRIAGICEKLDLDISLLKDKNGYSYIPIENDLLINLRKSYCKNMHAEIDIAVIVSSVLRKNMIKVSKISNDNNDESSFKMARRIMPKFEIINEFDLAG